mgnify:CR=1 FL=1
MADPAVVTSSPGECCDSPAMTNKCDKKKEEKKKEAATELPPCSVEAVAAFARTDDAYWASWWRKLKHLVVFVVLGPWRFVGVVLVLSVYALGLRVCALVHRCALADVELQGGLARRWFLLGKPLAMLILRLFGVRVTRRGDDSFAAPAGTVAAPRFVVANHVSMLDIFALYGAGVPDAIPSFVSKAGILDAPLIGTLLRACRGVAVYRSSATGRGTTHVLAERAACAAEPPVAIFPEGTTTNGTCLGLFHAGAFAAGAPVKPVCLRYTYTGFNPAYDVTEPFVWGYGILGATGIRLEIIHLPVYVPSDAERHDARLYANNVRALIARELALPVHDVTFRDKLAYMVQYMGYKMKEHED